MSSVTLTLISRLHATAAYKFSDKIILFFGGEYRKMDRSVVKLVSACSSLASAAFTKLFIESVCFFAEPIEFDSPEDAVSYVMKVRRKHTESVVNEACLWKMVHAGVSENNARKLLNEMTAENKSGFLGENWESDISEHVRFGSFAFRDDDGLSVFPITTRELFRLTRRLGDLLALSPAGELACLNSVG